MNRDSIKVRTTGSDHAVVGIPAALSTAHTLDGDRPLALADGVRQESA